MEFNIHNNDERQIICENSKDNTWSFDDKASQYLETGKIYTVIGVEIHSWHTRVTLKEIPNKQFHSSHFLEIE